MGRIATERMIKGREGKATDSVHAGLCDSLYMTSKFGEHSG